MTSPPALEDDDLLHEVLLRLPPQPPYLMRASLVCKRWRRLATESHFLRRFRLHHRRPPLLGVFTREHHDTWSFRSTLDLPSCSIPPERFSLELLDNPQLGWSLFDCRHGRLLLVNMRRRQFIVWNPISDDCCLVSLRPEFHRIHTGAVMLCAAIDDDHSGCHLTNPFKVAILGRHGAQIIASVYSSKTGIWGDLVSKELTYPYTYISSSSTLVGNTLYWWTATDGSTWYSILALDLDRQCLAEIEKPSFFLGVKKPSNWLEYDQSVQIIQAKDGGFGFAALWWRCTDYNETCLQVWERNVDRSGVDDTWVLSKSVTLNKILRLGNNMRRPRILLYVEDAHAILLRVGRSSIFMVQLESMQSKELLKSDYPATFHPFTSFYIG